MEIRMWLLTWALWIDPRWSNGRCSGWCWFLLRYVKTELGAPFETGILKDCRTGRTPTSSTSENKVPQAGMPWETGSTEGKYKYYPGGDQSIAPKDAPSAVNVVVVPEVNLPKVRYPP